MVIGCRRGVGGACPDASHTYQRGRTDPPSPSLYLSLCLSYIRQSADCSRTQGQSDFPPHPETAEKREGQLAAEEERDVIHGGSSEEYLTHKLPSV